MRRLASLWRSAIGLIKRQMRLNFSALLIIILVAAIVVIFVPNKRQLADSTEVSDSDTVATKTETELPETPAPVEQQDAPVSPASSGSTYKPTAGGQKRLIFSPSTITVIANSQTQYYYSAPINISSSDGRGVNMPGFRTFQQDKFQLNFPAGPAKANWLGEVLIYTTTPPGSYTIEMSAQDNNGVDYGGSVTIQILEPTMNISIQSNGYSADYDALLYTVKLDRLYGFSEEIEQVAVYDVTEPTFMCYYTEVDDSTIDLYCGNEEDPRPTNGTFKVEVATSSVAKSVSASYSLPPLP